MGTVADMGDGVGACRYPTEGKDDMRRTMRKTRIAAASVMVAAGLIGVVAAPATAQTHKLTGAFDGDPGSSVSMKVKVKHGKPKFVKDIRFSGMDLTCGIPPSPGGESDAYEALEKIRVKAGTKPPEYRDRIFDENEEVELVVTGTLRKKGKLSTGKMDLTLGVGSAACFGSDTFEVSKE